MSFGVLLHKGHGTVHAPWATRARRVLPGTELSPFWPLCAWEALPGFPEPSPEARLGLPGGTRAR